MGALGSSYHRNRMTCCSSWRYCSFRPMNRPPCSREMLIFCLVFSAQVKLGLRNKLSRVAPSDTLNPDQRVSAAGSPAFRRDRTCKDHLRVIAPVIHHRAMDVSETLRIPVGNHPCNWSPRGYRVTPYSHMVRSESGQN